jgi:O-antigen/teichoic acid export membrane protein
VDEKIQIVRWTYGYFILLSIVVAISFLIGPALLIVIVGEKYRSAADVVGWLVMGHVFNGMYLMVTNYIFYSKRTGLLSVSTVASGFINVGLLYVLIDYMGIKGAAVSFAASMLLKFILTWLVSSFRHPMPWFGSRVLTKIF